jgi:hypothetical protein
MKMIAHYVYRAMERFLSPQRVFDLDSGKVGNTLAIVKELN